MRFWIELERPDFEPEIERLEICDVPARAKAVLAKARQTWNEGQQVVIEGGDLVRLVIMTTNADYVSAIRLIDTWEESRPDGPRDRADPRTP